MARKKNPAAAAAAAAAVAAVNAVKEDKVWLFSNEDEDDDADETLQQELQAGLEQVDETSGEVVWWELYCDAPLEKAGMIKKLGTSELKNLREDCLQLGPGEYHVIARTTRGRFVKGTRHKIKISGFARPPAANPQTPATDPLMLLTQLEERAERRRAIDRDQRRAEIKFWAPILAPIGLELAKGLFGARGGESIKDLVAALVGMKELVGGGGGSSSDKAVDHLLKGIELARDLEPSKGATWPDALINGVTGLAKEFRPVIEQAQRNRPPQAAGQVQFQTAPTTPAIAAPQPAPAGETGPNGATPGVDMWALVEPLLQRLAQDLEDFAVNAADPDLAAEALLAKVPRTFRAMVEPEQIKQWLTQADWWELTVKFRPGLAPYQAFCDDVRQDLLQLFEPQSDTDAPAEQS